jgi:hypothetical protein
MLKRFLSIVLAGGLVFNGGVLHVFAQTLNNSRDAEKVEAEVVKRGTNEKKRVRVKMLNGSKLKGYISQIGDESFTVISSKTKQPTVIAYRDAEKVESGGLAGGARLGIIIGAAVGATLIILYIAFQNAIRDN